MNWFKWILCWFYKRHIYTLRYELGMPYQQCVRCGHTREIE